MNSTNQRQQQKKHTQSFYVCIFMYVDGNGNRKEIRNSVQQLSDYKNLYLMKSLQQSPFLDIKTSREPCNNKVRKKNFETWQEPRKKET